MHGNRNEHGHFRWSDLRACQTRRIVGCGSFALSLLVATAAASPVSVFAGGPPLSGETELLDPDDASGNFGTAVAIDGTFAVIGSPVAIVGNSTPGSAAVFRRTGGTWSHVTTLTASDGSNFDLFGQSVGLSRDTIVIGAPRADVDFVPNQGAAYVFRRDAETGQWAEQAKLTAFDGAGGDEFGRSVAIDGDLIVVGSDLIPIDGEQLRGAAYVHRRSATTGTWTQEAKLTVPDDGLPFDQFASSVSVSGDTIAIGSPGSDGTFQDQGAIYVFDFILLTPTFGQWIWTGKLLAPDGGQSDNLGAFSQGTVIRGDIIVAGAVDNNQDDNQIGAAYVFRRQFIDAQQIVWNFEAKLTPPDGESTDQFGFSVSHTGGSALVGAPSADDGDVLDRGAGYFFTRSPTGIWSFRQKLVAAGDQPFESGGRSVALSGTAALLGRPFAEPDGQQPDAGAVSAWSCGDLIFADGAEVFTGCGL